MCQKSPKKPTQRQTILHIWKIQVSIGESPRRSSSQPHFGAQNGAAVVGILNGRFRRIGIVWENQMSVSKNNGENPQIIHFNRVFHDKLINHLFWGPTPIFGNTQIKSSLGTPKNQRMRLGPAKPQILGSPVTATNRYLATDDFGVGFSDHGTPDFSKF